MQLALQCYCSADLQYRYRYSLYWQCLARTGYVFCGTLVWKGLFYPVRACAEGLMRSVASVCVCSYINKIYYTKKKNRLFSALPLEKSLTKCNCCLLFKFKLSKLIMLYKIQNDLLYFPSNILLPIPPPLHSSRHFSKFNLKSPYCKTQSYYSSYFPAAIRLWNSLPDEIKTSSSLSSFKRLVFVFLSQN